jgi:hypothetical protein
VSSDSPLSFSLPSHYSSYLLCSERERERESFSVAQIILCGHVGFVLEEEEVGVMLVAAGIKNPRLPAV